MKYQCVLQYSEEDCGAACIATIVKYYKRTFALNRIREAIGTGQLGTTLLGLRRGAEALGFNARQVRADPEIFNRLDKVSLPAIIHWKGQHWVVLYGQQGKKYAIADPAIGIRYLSRKELTAGWANGIMLLLVPDEIRFYAQPEDTVSSFRRLVARVLPYRHLITQALLVNLVIGLLSLASPLLIQILTDDVLVRKDADLLTTVAIGVIAVRVFSDLLRLVQSHLIAHFAERFQLGLILEFGRQILRLPLNYYEARRSGEIVSRLRDIREINHLISQVVIKLPSRFFIALISLGLMSFYSWKLTLAVLIMAACMTVSTLIFLPAIQQKTRQVLVTSAENQGVLVETFKGALTLKTINAGWQIWEEFQTRFSRLANVHLQTVQIGIFNRIFSRLVDGVGTIAILWLGSTFVIRQELSIGQLLAFNALSDNFIYLIETLVEFVDEFARAQTASQRLNEVIDSSPEEQEQVFKPRAEISGSADIICTNLNFYHAGRVNLLENFSVTIPGGKITALIGQSGCGKSTLAKLIARLYQPQSGNIRFGRYNQQDLALECLREQVVLVPQEPHFWSRSIIDNFRLSFPQVSFEKIVRACQITGADEFISQLPDKYQTVLGEFGANISGGQKQKLALARAIVNNPPILILDESTNSLDPLSETQVLDRLLSSRKGKTTIIISHSPTVISRADWIIQIDNGQLQLTGEPQELRQLPGVHNQFLTNVEG